MVSQFSCFISTKFENFQLLVADVQNETNVKTAPMSIYSNTDIGNSAPMVNCNPMPKAQMENNYMNHADISLIHSMQNKQIDRTYENGANTNSKVALQFDDNSDYAVIDCCNSSSSNHNSSIDVDHNNQLCSNNKPMQACQYGLNTTDGVNIVLPTYQQKKDNLTPGTDDVVDGQTSVTNNYISIANYNRTLLQNSLCEAKSRVAQLKRELDANYNLLSIIDKYYTKGDNNQANAIEV